MYKAVAMIFITSFITACTTTGGLLFSQNNCDEAIRYINAVQVLDDAGELSDTNSSRFETAKEMYSVVCNNPNTTSDQLVQAAQMYVMLVTIWKNAQ